MYLVLTKALCFQAIDNHYVYYRYPQEYERQEVRRVPSPESVVSC